MLKNKIRGMMSISMNNVGKTLIRQIAQIFTDLLAYGSLLPSTAKTGMGSGGQQ